MGSPDSSRISRLAIFPLPDVVLFPGVLLPLHVFEPRYREMTADALAGNLLLGIVRLAPGFESDYEGRPAVHDVATVGEIIESQQLPDGRYTMVVRGRDRIRIVRELPPERAYREVEAEILDSEDTLHPGDIDKRREELVLLCDQLAGTIDVGGPELRSLVHRAASASELADTLAGAILADVDERQTLLETLDPAIRLDLLIEHVSTLLVELTPRTSMPN